MATVDSIINDNLLFVDNKKNDMQSFVNQIADASNITFDNIISDLTVFHTPLESQVETINNIVGSFPEPPSILIPGYEVPEIPEISISSIEHDLTTLEAARAEMLSDLQNGGYGIDSDDETQLLDRARSRTVKIAKSTVDELVSDHVQRRFKLPPGVLYDQMSRAQEESKAALSETNREIYIERARQFFQARQFAIQTAATLDRTRADILEVKFRIEEARARFTLASFASQLDKYRLQLSTAIETSQLSVRLFEANSNIVSDRIRAAAESAKISIASYDSNVREFLGTLEYRLNRSRAELEAVKSQEDLRLKAATAGTDFYSRIVSGALSAVNTVVSQSTEE